MTVLRFARQSAFSVPCVGNRSVASREKADLGTTLIWRKRRAFASFSSTPPCSDAGDSTGNHAQQVGTTVGDDASAASKLKPSSARLSSARLSIDAHIGPVDLEASGRLTTAVTSSAASDFVKAVPELSKAKLSALVVSTSTAGFLAAGGPISYPTLAACAFGTALCSSSASTFNQVFEIERDRRMKRTRHRPLVKGAVSPVSAVALATATGVGGGGLLLAGTDPVTAALGVANIGLYAGVYTSLKTKSEINTWVGAVVGAIPPVMGWTAATGGSLLDLEAAFLGGTLFLWQFPHFFALSWMHRVDYARGGFQMVPVNDPDGDRTADLITRYTWYLSTVPLASSALGVTSSMFAVEGVALNAYALYVAKKFDDERSNSNARKVFLTSLWYLPCLMTLFILHSRKWKDEEEVKEDGIIDFQAWLHKKASELRHFGREHCVHEIVVAKDEVGSEDKCPIALGKSKAKEASDKGVEVASVVVTNLETEK
eukprot:CAMPEP_0113592032 /NCGR_PEP_ID=MMETSP0015_2-20120614/37613_1 /TAXON_ID=2838 /ORGANISM="Odontella" /LENGTH=485 /DNA_ID=CAMNT_0000498507 /DNA_START=46 /DNA_END=1503 /DNA_ORIENTATION=+ /assembly_acc=CAM_ASM_000160